METKYCTHLRDLSLDALKKQLESKRPLPRLCTDCSENIKGPPKKQSLPAASLEERTEVLYICLTCLYVGCTRGKSGHAAIHSQHAAGHDLVAKLNGELHCYACDLDVEGVRAEDKQKMAELQRLLREVVAVGAETQDSHQVSSKQLEEEEKGFAGD